MADVVGQNQRENTNTHTQTHTPLSKVNRAGNIANGPQEEGGAACGVAKRRIRGGRGITDQLAAGAKRFLGNHFTGRRCTVTSPAVRRPAYEAEVPALVLSHGRLYCAGYLFSHPPCRLFSAPGTPGWVLMTTGWPPHGQGMLWMVVSPPKVLLAAQVWPSDPKHFAGDLGSLAVMPVTLRLEMPMSSHMSCSLAFDGIS